jgi:hypothetical protein
MSEKTHLEEYLARANEAEAMAAKFPDTDTFPKSSWLDIARGYRELAEAEQAKGPPSAQPSLASPTDPQT